MPKQTLAHNEQLVEALCDSIATGMYVNLACQSVGISTSALSEWKKKGQQGIHPYDKVWQRIQIAEAKAIERRIKRIEEEDLIFLEIQQKIFKQLEIQLQKTCFMLGTNLFMNMVSFMEILI